jgi:hypothetical protein
MKRILMRQQAVVGDSHEQGIPTPDIETSLV